ncbi:MAG: MOSC domain-containing protein [Streptosporangiaceae bacterium]
MSSPRVISVNVGRAFAAEWAGRLKRTAIDKRPVEAPVGVRRLGLAGDEQADTKHHGGPDQAVYAYAREDLDWWAESLGRLLPDGAFGENLTVRGVDVTGALLGERWRVGTALLEVTAPRIPCSVFRNWMGERGWVKRFADASRVGAYFRVLEEGEVAAGDPLTVVCRPEPRVTIAEAVRAWYGDAAVMRRLLAIPGISPTWDNAGRRVLAGTSRAG